METQPAPQSPARVLAEPPSNTTPALVPAAAATAAAVDVPALPMPPPQFASPRGHAVEARAGGQALPTLPRITAPDLAAEPAGGALAAAAAERREERDREQPSQPKRRKARQEVCDVCGRAGTRLNVRAWQASAPVPVMVAPAAPAEPLPPRFVVSPASVRAAHSVPVMGGALGSTTEVRLATGRLGSSGAAQLEWLEDGQPVWSAVIADSVTLLLASRRFVVAITEGGHIIALHAGSGRLALPHVVLDATAALATLSAEGLLLVVLSDGAALVWCVALRVCVSLDRVVLTNRSGTLFASSWSCARHWWAWPVATRASVCAVA
jgi:hypothetical protein